MILPPPSSTLFPYTTLFRSDLALTNVPSTFAVPATSSSGSIVDYTPPTVEPDELRSEEHTSELQSHSELVCRLLLEKKNDGERCTIKQSLIRTLFRLVEADP